MNAFAYAERWGHEEVVILRDAPSGLHAIVALRDTTLGPAIGGTRMREYASEEDALLDALRLARAMTYKSAMAGLGGRFHTGTDMGLDGSDIAVMARVADGIVEKRLAAARAAREET